MASRKLPLFLTLVLSAVISGILSQGNGRQNSSPVACNIGGIFDSNATVSEFHYAVMNLPNNGVSCLSYATRMNKNPVRAAIDVCEKLIPHKVHAILMSHSQPGILSPAAVSYAGGTYGIPVIGISSRDSAFSDKVVHTTFLRTVPPFSHQADVLAQLLCELQYTRVLFIHSSDVDGRATMGRFQVAISSRNYCNSGKPNAAPAREEVDWKVQVEASIEYNPGLKSFKKELEEVETFQAKVYILQSSKDDAEVIFHDAVLVGMTGEGILWLVTEEVLGARNLPVGSLGLRLVAASDQSSHLRDSISVVASALVDFSPREKMTEPPSNCGSPDSTRETRNPFFHSLLSVSFNGKTGRVAFDENGDRMYADYDVVNFQESREVTVGTYHYSTEKDTMELRIIEEKIVWPGHESTQPRGYAKATHLKVLTIEENPFVSVRKVKSDSSIAKHTSRPSNNSKSYHVKRLSSLETKYLCHDDEIPCAHLGASMGEGKNIESMHCCKGFCIDLLKELANKVNFTYSLALSPDGQYGSYVMKNTSAGRKKGWTGMIGEIVAMRADMIAAPLTINPERSECMDFSQPFKYQSINILERKPSRSSTLVSFLKPFDNTLWMLVLASVHLVALVLCLLDRFSPFSRFKSVVPAQDPSTAGLTGKRASCATLPTVAAYAEEDALNLSSAIWFAWGVLLNSGIGEGTPRSFSAKVLGIVWAAFAMMIVASYTANLAAFLVLERPYAKPTSINEAMLMKSFGNLTCATVKGSAVDMFFQRQVELSHLYQAMEQLNYDTADQAIQDVKNGNLKAFIWDNSRLEFEAAMDCELVTAGEVFGQSGYGIGLQKDSPWTTEVMHAILKFHEDGFMESLDRKWFPHLREEGPGIQCDGIHPTEKTPTTLGLSNMAGVFILVLAGIFGGAALLVIEVTYKRHHAKCQYRRELARYAFDKWRSVVVKRHLIRATVAAHQRQMLQRKLQFNGVADSIPVQSPTKDFPFGTLIPSSVGNVGSVAAAAANVDLIQQVSPVLDHIDSFDDIEDICSDFASISPK